MMAKNYIEVWILMEFFLKLMYDVKIIDQLQLSKMPCIHFHYTSFFFQANSVYYFTNNFNF